MRELAYYNGEYGDAADMKVPFTDRASFFGDGVYDATYCVERGIFALSEHIDRLYRSADAVGIVPPIGKIELADTVRRLVKLPDSPNLFVYIQFTRGSGTRSHNWRGGKANLWIYLYPKDVTPPCAKLKAVTLPDNRYGLCSVKTINLLPNVLAAELAADRGCDEAIFLKDGRVTECAHSNISIIKDGVLFTAPADGNILAGISRAHLISVCESLDIPCRYVSITYDALKGADEVIITSSGVPCSPCVEIDGDAVGGRAPAKLQALQDLLYRQYELVCAMDRRI
ncbi:MAG: aminotransferase class IV [Clostridia bacterium]|nr:aminotransferase class IV [Clostridia bacterium]